jgi:hypothetical protein
VTAASLVVLAPPEPWDEARLLAAARGIEPPAGRTLRPGDDVGGLVVLRVEPEAGAAAGLATALDVLAAPRRARGPLHLAVLVDASESMGTPWDATRTRLDAAFETLRAFLVDERSPAALVTLFSYARDVRAMGGPIEPRSLRTFEAPAAPRGPSRTAHAVDAALAHLAAQSHEGAQAIAVLTDGGGEAAPLRAAARRAARLRVPLHFLVFAPEIDPVLAEAADATGGSAAGATFPLTLDFPRPPA